MGRKNKILRVIWQEFVYGGHLLSLGFAGIALSVIILLSAKIEWPILAVAYLISQISYTYNHFKEAAKDAQTNPERVEHLQKINKYFSWLIAIYVLALFSIIISLYSTHARFSLFVFFLFVIGIFYTKFFKGLTQKIIGFKNLYVSLCWAVGGAFLPLFYYSFSFNPFFLLFFLFVFFRLVFNTIYFDFKDIAGDKKEQLLTLPVRYGAKTTLKFLHIFNLISFVPIILGVILQIIPVYSLGLIVFYFYSFYYLQKAKKTGQKALRSLSYIMADGEYILWPVVVWLAKFLMS